MRVVQLTVGCAQVYIDGVVIAPHTYVDALGTTVMHRALLHRIHGTCPKFNFGEATIKRRRKGEKYLKLATSFASVGYMLPTVAIGTAELHQKLEYHIQLLLNMTTSNILLWASTPVPWTSS